MHESKFDHLQAAIPVTTFAAGVVTVHLVMALLEKKRIENWQEKGEVSKRAWLFPVLTAGYLVSNNACVFAVGVQLLRKLHEGGQHH